MWVFNVKSTQYWEIPLSNLIKGSRKNKVNSSTPQVLKSIFSVQPYSAPILICLPGIRQLQLMLLKVCLILGVEIHVSVEFTGLAEPPKEQLGGGKHARTLLSALATTLLRTHRKLSDHGKTCGEVIRKFPRYLQQSHSRKSIDRGCWQLLLWGELLRGSQLSRGILITTLVLCPQVLGGEPSSNPPTILSQIFISTWWLEPMDAKTH